MRLVLDGVFNHCGRGFWAFHHVVENGAASPLGDWFHIQQWPLKPSGRRKSCGYDCWWAIPDLPKFNHANRCSGLPAGGGPPWLEQGN